MTRELDATTRLVKDRLRRVVQDLGPTQARLAGQIGVTPQAVSLWLGSTPTLPAADQLIQLARLGVDVHWLLTGTSAPALVQEVQGIRGKVVHSLQRKYPGYASEIEEIVPGTGLLTASLEDELEERLIERLNRRIGADVDALLIEIRKALPPTKQSLVHFLLPLMRGRGLGHEQESLQPSVRARVTKRGKALDRSRER